MGLGVPSFNSLFFPKGIISPLLNNLLSCASIEQGSFTYLVQGNLDANIVNFWKLNIFSIKYIELLAYKNIGL